MSNLYMFRIKVIETNQITLFKTSSDRTKLLTKIINEKPSVELRKGYIWHIGNVDNIGDDGLLFAVGRTTKTSKELYDDATGNFLEVDDVESPFTHILFDKYYSTLGIVPKRRLAPTVKGIARNLEKLLNHHSIPQNEGIRIEISEIPDPEGFLHHIQTAYQVTSYTVEFGEPNPFDVDDDFHRPMENYLRATGGQNGKTTVSGEDLNRDSIERVTRSIASTGKNAKARIKEGPDQRPVSKSLNGNPVQIPFSEEDKNDMKVLLERFKKAYEEVRGRNNHD